MNKEGNLSNEVIDILEEQGWNVHEYERQGNGRYHVEIEQYSPAGEDYITSILYDGTDNDFIREIEETSWDFDVDEHVELWIDGRGKNGVPSSIRELVEDAEAIEKMLADLSDALWPLLNEI